jgi:EmrB/QacA subfamily drug resistance transporter
MSSETPQGNFDHLPGYATRWKGLIFIGISLIVISLDNTILNVAIPSISRDLGASASQLQWIIDAYVLVFAALLLTMGALSDRFGRKRVLQFGLIMFGIGSAAAGLSGSTNMLIASRAFLGIGGAVIMPATLSIISATFPREERAQAIAIWAAVFGLGVGIGPVIGGLLLERFEWNAVFFVNLPVVALAVAGGAVYLAESKDESAPKTDIPGVILSITGLFALVYGIIEAGELGWTDSQVLTSFGIAAVLLTAFAIWEARNPDAMLPMHFFKNMSFTGANVAMVLVMFSLFGSIFFLSQYMQSVLGYSALGAGLRLLPLALTLMVVAANSATIAERIGTKFTVATGIAITGTSLLIMSRAYEVDSGYGVILGTIVLFAVGMGLTFSPATNSIMQSVPVSKAGIGSAMNDTTRQLGGALGVAVLGTIMNDVYLDRIGDIDEILPQLPAPVHEAIASSIQGAHIAAANPTVPDAARETIINMANGAFVNGMNDAMLIGAIIMYAASVLTLLILPSRVRRPQEEIERETMQRQAETVAAPLVAGD